ncbi:MAG: MoxR family ATPase [Deltaproteobacteria bacterium]|nr:MoxR family ATPase [Deltaproteobacteria bacterium]
MSDNLSQQQVTEKMAWMAERLATLRGQLARVVVGQDAVIEAVILGMLAGGHVLLEGVPGLGKTLLVRTLAQALDLQFARVQFTPDLKASDVLGTQVLVEDGQGGRALVFQQGPIFTQVLLADEINRATPKTQSALLEAMQERSVTIGTKTYTLQAPFFVLATQNPLEMEGTYPLPEAQLDRFVFKIEVPFPTTEELHTIVERTVSGHLPEVNKVLTGQEILTIHEFAIGCPIARHVVDYAVQLVHGSHGSLGSVKRWIRAGASPRALQALVMGAKLRALLQGRPAAAIEDVRALAKPALRHRLLLSFDAEAEGVRADAVVEQMLQELDKKLR